MAGKDQSQNPDAGEWTESTEPIETGQNATTEIVETELDLSGIGGASSSTTKRTTSSGLTEETVVAPTGAGKKPAAREPSSAGERRGSKLAERNRAHREAVAAQEKADAPVVLRGRRDEELDRRGIKAAAIMLGAAVLIGVVAAVLAFHPGTEVSDNKAFVDQSATSELIGKANELVCVPFAYDFQKFDDLAARSRAALTGKAAADYRKYIDTIRSQAEQAKMTSECKAEWVGVMDLHGDSAEVLAQLIISQTAAGQIAGSLTPRAQFHFVKVDGEWKIGSVGDF